MNKKNCGIFNGLFAESRLDLAEKVTLVFVGKENTGKSSLINAIMLRNRNNPVAEVSVNSDENKTKAIRLDSNVLIIESTDINNIYRNNHIEKSDRIDIAVMVVAGLPDSSCYNCYLELNQYADNVLVVLNKIDELDYRDEAEYQDFIKQWEDTFCFGPLYPVCAKGYCSGLRKGAPMDLRGIEDVYASIFGNILMNGKDLLLARHLGDKRKYASQIISNTLLSLFSHVRSSYRGLLSIAEHQVVAIASLYYLYTGKMLSIKDAFSLIPCFLDENQGRLVFESIKPFLIPKKDAYNVNAGATVLLTLAMLAEIDSLMSKGFDIGRSDEFEEVFSNYKKSTESDFMDAIMGMIGDKKNMEQKIYAILYK